MPHRCLNALLEFWGAGVLSGISSVPGPWSQCISHLMGTGKAQPPTKWKKMQQFSFWWGHLARNRKYSDPHLGAMNYINKYKHKIWVGSPSTQKFLVCSPPTHKYYKICCTRTHLPCERISIHPPHVCFVLFHLLSSDGDTVFKADKALHFFPLSIFELFW